MKCLIVFSLLVSMALCQQWPFLDIFNWNSEKIHDYIFEFHRRQSVMLIRDQKACYIVNVDSTIEDDLQHKDTRERLEDALYQQIKADKGEKLSSIDHLRTDVQDMRGVFECFHHDVYELTYMSASNVTK